MTDSDNRDFREVPEKTIFNATEALRIADDHNTYTLEDVMVAIYTAAKFGDYSTIIHSLISTHGESPYDGTKYMPNFILNTLKNRGFEVGSKEHSYGGIPTIDYCISWEKEN